MNSLAESGLNFPTLLVYGFLILIYIAILKTLVNLLQHMGDKHRTHKSVVDTDIRRTMTRRVETSMHTFDIYSIAIVIAKAGITVIAMAAVIVLLIVKTGLIVTALLIGIVVLLLWTVNYLVKRQKSAKPDSIRSETQKYLQKSGGIGTVVALSITLIVLIFVMIWVA